MSTAPSAGTTATASGSRRSMRLAVGVVLLTCTLVARLPGTVHDALWQDEIATMHVISMPTLRGSLRQIVSRESTPPAYYVIARSADAATSGVEARSRVRVLRAVSIAFSLACTALTFALACRLLPPWAAALAGALASFASILVLHGYELRSYSLLALSCVAFALVLERATEQPRHVRLAVLSGVVVLGSLTHYFFLFTLAAGALWLLVSRRPRSTTARVGAALLVGLLPLVAWSPYWLRQYQHGAYATAPRLTFEYVLEFVPTLFAPRALVGTMGIAAAAAVTIATLASTGLLLRRSEGRLCALLVLVPVVSVVSLVWVTGERVFHTRNLIGVAPFAAIALAWGCAALPWRRVSYATGALVVALVLAGFAYGQTSLGRTPYDRIADEVVAQGFRRDEPVLWFGAYGGIFPFTWYLSTDEPVDMWPRFTLSSPNGAACSAVAVVARTRTGRRWLEQHRDAVLAEASIPSFGDVPQGRPRPDVIVARLSWSPGILDRPDLAQRRFRLHRADTASPCLAP